MAFLTSNKWVESQILAGANAPREVIRRDALRVARPATTATPNNALAQNYRGVMAGAKDITNIQSRVVNAVIHRKLGSKTSPGLASWRGRLFGG